jgi:putative peptide zinc metalloprotease protein
MYIEIILATIATFVWWFVQPGLVQEICLQIMLVSSVSTVLFNGNPLLRFDGYYIMSDVLEIPNLHQKSSTALNTLLGRHWLGLEMPDDPLLPRNRMLAFATFTVAAFLYRFFVLFSILMFLTHWLEPYGLETIGQGIAWFSLFGMLFWPAFKLYRFMSVPGRVMQMKPKRFGTVGLIALTVIGAILFVPFPSNLSCRAIIVPKNIEAVYAQVQGKVVELPIEEGKQVAAGDLLARLDSVELQLELERLQNELTSANEQLAAAQRLSLELDDASQGSKYIYELPTLKQQVTNLQEAIALKKSELAATTITSPIAGTVIAAPLTPNFPGQFETPLIDVQPVVSGNQHNIHLARGQRLCEIADLSSWQAVILLTERQVKFAEIGQTARIKLHAYPGTTLKSDLDVVWYSDPINVRSSKDETFDNLQAKARLPDPVRELVAKIDQESLQYLAVAPIDAEGLRLKIGMDGQCRLKMPNRSLAQRFWWWFNENFGT